MKETRIIDMKPRLQKDLEEKEEKVVVTGDFKEIVEDKKEIEKIKPRIKTKY